MTKAELVAQIAKESGITKTKAGTALKSLIEAIGQVLKKDGQIQGQLPRHVQGEEEEGAIRPTRL